MTLKAEVWPRYVELYYLKTLHCRLCSFACVQVLELSLLSLLLVYNQADINTLNTNLTLISSYFSHDRRKFFHKGP